MKPFRWMFMAAMVFAVSGCGLFGNDDCTIDDGTKRTITADDVGQKACFENEDAAGSITGPTALLEAETNLIDTFGAPAAAVPGHDPAPLNAVEQGKQARLSPEKDEAMKAIGRRVTARRLVAVGLYQT